MMQITTHSADETQALGQKLASRLAPGDVIAYFGDLGAGKTAFTRGLDMYRLSSSDELFDIGWEDYLSRGGVCAVEWSENVEDALQDAIRVTIEKDADEPDTRHITITGGPRFEDPCL